MSGVKIGGVFIATLRDKRSDTVKWSDTFGNLVVSTGLIHILDVAFAGGTQVDPWYIGLVGDNSSDISTSDKMSTHAFTESTAYDESTRVTFVDAASGVSVSNSGNLATFTLDADGTTIGGAFLASSEEAGGSAGILLCAAAFSGGDKTGDSGDKLEVTYTFTAADDGA